MDVKAAKASTFDECALELYSETVHNGPVVAKRQTGGSIDDFVAGHRAREFSLEKLKERTKLNKA